LYSVAGFVVCNWCTSVSFGSWTLDARCVSVLYTYWV